jgi:hypothetical protein
MATRSQIWKAGIVSLLLLPTNCSRLDSPYDRLEATGGLSATHAVGGESSTRSGSNAGNSTGGALGTGGGSANSCTDPSGFDGRGCYSCVPVDIGTLESACTNSVCTAFDNYARLTRLLSNGQLPALPASGAVSGGAASVATTIAATGSVTSGGATALGNVTSLGGTSTSTPVGSGGMTSTGGASAGNLGCESLSSSGTVIYVTGSSAAKPFLQQIAQQLSGLGVYIVYTSTGSCVGVDAIINSTPMTTGALPAPATSATYWESSSSTGSSCDLPIAGVTADLGVSDVFAQTCPGFELASLDSKQVRDAHGPIQTMAFVVSANSSCSEISAQAAYFVFGFGKDGGVLDATAARPLWNDENYLLQRSASSGTQAMISAAIGVPAALWKGKAHSSSGDVAADLQSAAATQDTADKAIGILAADYIDSKNLRAQIRILAYQDSNQPCSFYPDSTATARDKRNVRDGHYPIWSPLHILYKADSSGNPANSTNRQQTIDIIGYISGSKVLPNGIKLIDVYAQSGLIPECAMHVERQKDGGNILPYQPANPCSCLFELKATGSTSCNACTVQGDCAQNETCSQGFCEK